MQTKTIPGNHTTLTEVATLKKKTVMRGWEKWEHLGRGWGGVGEGAEKPAKHQNPFGQSSES